MASTVAIGDAAQRTRLVMRAQGGDAAAFDELARHYRPAVLALAFSRTGDREAAEDLAQEALVLAWRHLPTLTDPAAFPAWLRQVAANACRSWLRRRPWPESLEDCAEAAGLAAAGPNPLAAALARAEARELRAALYALPDANRYALLMHVWGGYTCEEIAEFLQVPGSTVEGRIQRAKAQLRRLLAGRADGPVRDLLAEPWSRWREEQR